MRNNDSNSKNIKHLIVNTPTQTNSQLVIDK